jgi:hypothetical protein
MNPLHFGWKPDSPWVEELGVELVLWPDGAWLRARLARAGVPRLLVVRAAGEPPGDLGSDEDFVRLPVSDSVLRDRAKLLVDKVHELSTHEPTLDPAGVLRHGSTTRSFGQAEAAALRLLIQRLGTIVDREDLMAVAWSGRLASQDALDALISRLRQKLAGTGLEIRTSRRRGFQLRRPT